MPWDVAVWLDILTVPSTASADDYYGKIERWMQGNYNPPYENVHPEWSKGWAYTASRGAWTNRRFLQRRIKPTAEAAQGRLLRSGRKLRANVRDRRFGKRRKTPFVAPIFTCVAWTLAFTSRSMHVCRS